MSQVTNEDRFVGRRKKGQAKLFLLVIARSHRARKKRKRRKKEECQHSNNKKGNKRELARPYAGI